MENEKNNQRAYLLKLSKKQLQTLGVLSAIEEKSRAELMREAIDLLVGKYGEAQQNDAKMV